MNLSLFITILILSTTFLSCSDDKPAAAAAASSASVEATFASTLNSAVPTGLKAALSADQIRELQDYGYLEDVSFLNDAADFMADDFDYASRMDLTSDCAASYTSCPNVTEANGWDSNTGEILMKLWAIDYNSACTSAYLADGTCFQITGMSGYNTFIKPTLLASPTACGSTSSSSARYVNFGVDPCYFDNKIQDISNYSSCKSRTGTAYSITAIVPWYSTWNIPATISFQGFSGDAGAGMYWTISNTDSKKYFISVDDNWMYGGIKDTSANEFFFFGTGSPAYFATQGSSGTNLSAYAGDIPQNGVLGTFETIQIRSQGSNKYIHRQIVNSTHVWYQDWTASFPTSAAAATAVKDTPDGNRCLQIGASVSASKYVPLASCVTAFSKASVNELNQDSNYKLKIFDEATLNSINFSTRLVSTDSACL